MEFSRPGPQRTDCAEHGMDCAGDDMLVVREALLSQLQKERLRQEMIVAELARVERAMALRAAASGHHPAPIPRVGDSTGAERVMPPWPFIGEQYRGNLAGLDNYAGVGYEHDGRSERLKPSDGKADLQNSASGEQKPPGSGETVPPNKASPALAVKTELIGTTIPVKKPNLPMKWSCPVCQVETNSEKNLQDHFAGQKHKLNVAALGSGVKATGYHKAKTTVEPSPVAGQVRTSSIQWSCSTCKAKGTSGSTFEAHLKGKRHLQNIAAVSREGSSDDLLKKVVLPEAKLQDSDMPKNAERTPSVWSCSICRTFCTCESDLKNHLKGKKHLDEVQALVEERPKKTMKYSGPPKANSNPDIVPKHADKIDSRWFCRVCHANCTCKSDLENHIRGKRHQQNLLDLWENITQKKDDPLQVVRELEGLRL